MKFSKMLAAITQVLNQDSDTQVDVCMTSEMARRIELWTAMYEDNAPWVDRKKVKSAQLPAAIASEVARLVTLEMKSEITGGSSATYLNEQYQKKVLKSIRRYVEYGCAKGGLILKPYVTKTGLATVYKGNIIKNLIMDCQSYTKYRPNETTGGIFVSWRRKEELPTGA